MDVARAAREALATSSSSARDLEEASKVGFATLRPGKAGVAEATQLDPPEADGRTTIQRATSLILSGCCRMGFIERSLSSFLVDVRVR